MSREMSREVLPLGPVDPEALGPYRLLGRVGEGGMGVVYLAVDPVGRHVAVKAIHRAFASNAEFLVRFRREVAAARQVPRFCTAAVLDAELDGDVPYLVTEYVDGPSLLDDVVRSGPFDDERLMALAVGAAAALTAIHEAGVVHRDLKPANVLLSDAGPRVIDFGVASAADATAHTLTGQVIGTPAYMAPEQINGDRATAAADVFAWGGVVAYAASGEPPFGTAASIPAVMHRILHEPPRLDTLDVDLRAVVVAAMAKEPADRPTSRELFDRVRRLAAAEGHARRAAAEVIEHATPAGVSAPWGPGPAVPTPTAAPLGPRPPAPPSAPPFGAPTVLPDVGAGGQTGQDVTIAPHAAPPAAVLVVATASAVVVDPLGWRDEPTAVAGGTPATTADGPTGEGPIDDTTDDVVAPVVVHDVHGTQVAVATSRLEADDLVVVTEPRASVPADAGKVLAVQPSPGTELAPGDTVTLFVGDGTTPSVAGDQKVFKRVQPGGSLNVADIVSLSPAGDERVVGVGDSPDVTADGRLIVYVDTTSVERGSQVVVVSPQGGNRRVITDITVGSARDAAIAPDGRLVAYTNNTGGIYVVAPDGSGRREAFGDDAFELDFSPDGQRLVFRRSSDQSLWVVGVDGSGLRKLPTALRGDKIPSFPAWSPDGDLIAFSDFRGTVYTIGADGSDQRIAARNSTYPSWSSDGGLVVTAGTTAYLTRPDGGDAVPIAGVVTDGPLRLGRR
ncbi:protein kinase [Nocardioides sp. C4-1]|uniref:protein kinase domain-containing protein n=1 Tax=Nocardioides sp. C4-1 TaxID=3151851 RepID=UPI0032678275